ncbi:MAG: GNAT family N-acetyltransferase [Actinobacteria bacterium]|nr:GNAT family N-acetyltransferase [Actinomycetota bacterium]
MTSDEFAAFRKHTIVEYARAHSSVGNWSEEEAIEKSTQAINELLPDGQDTAETLVLTALGQSGESIGYLWIGLQRRGGSPGEAWIYDIEIYERFRGKGYGRDLLLLAESEARRHGVIKMGLNVFGNNLIARNLYDSAGYEITAMQMSKDL